ncbi:DUF418 domain-containing protein [Streptomyces odontomachi]|uniref:DUF418 domain-containing protein n=1 Tax=Streptomyces odontomachi TaxID=2944940 RepID=UPI00210AEB3A|nr:DUF418 domain-containing protein [Streptomyces sp. ODS25]
MTASLTTAPASTGPVRRAERVLAPDLARGAMLLFIALANAANCAFAGQPGMDGTPHGAQRVVNFLMITFIDSHAYPVFAVMFGYGLVQIARRQGAAARRVLLRRNACLVGLGLVHGTLLYFGDFLGAYGIVGLVATLLLLPRGDRFHRLVLWVWGIQIVMVGYLAVTALTGAHRGHAVLTDTANPSLAASSYARSVLDRLTEWPEHTVYALGFIVIAWLGIWAARHQILENPAAHRVLLRRTAVGCLGLAFAGALPYALVAAGVLHVDADTVHALAYLNDVSGEYGGPGYVALFGLIALRLGAAGGGRTKELAPALKPVVALGQRSLSGYLLQSVAWLVLFSPWMLHLGGTYTAAVAAVSVWLLSLAAAQALSVRDQRGPAETLLRRITYRVTR